MHVYAACMDFSLVIITFENLFIAMDYLCDPVSDIKHLLYPWAIQTVFV